MLLLLFINVLQSSHWQTGDRAVWKMSLVGLIIKLCTSIYNHGQQTYMHWPQQRQFYTDACNSGILWASMWKLFSSIFSSLRKTVYSIHALSDSVCSTCINDTERTAWILQLCYKSTIIKQSLWCTWCCRLTNLNWIILIRWYQQTWSLHDS